jgi:NADH-quinone oxidoreductase subunit G
VQKAAWGKFGKAGKLDKVPVAVGTDNFYMTNPICRASLTMAQCSGEMAEDKGATGTNG